MKLPKSVLIKGERWHLKKTKNLHDDKGDLCLGICDYEKRVIQVDPEQNNEMFLYTLIHELMHASLHELHIDISDDLNEVISDGVGFILSQLFHIKFK